MTNQQILDAIEEGEVLFDLLYATGVLALQARLERNEVLAVALDRVRTDGNFLKACIERARAIASLPEQVGYAHPSRTAVAAYAYLLFNADDLTARVWISEATNLNRQDWLEASELIREYQRRLPTLEIHSICDTLHVPERKVDSWPIRHEEDVYNHKSAKFESSDPSFVPRKHYALAA